MLVPSVPGGSGILEGLISGLLWLSRGLEVIGFNHRLQLVSVRAHILYPRGHILRPP
jgi:hypothetical protein